MRERTSSIIAAGSAVCFILSSVAVVALPRTVSSVVPAASAQSTTYPEGSSADVSVTGSGPSSVDRGANFSFTYTVVNSGPNVARNVIVTRSIPSGWVFLRDGTDASCNAEGTQVVCRLATLSTASPKTVAITYQTPYQDACTDMTTMTTAAVTVDPSQTDPNPNNNQTTVTSTTIRCRTRPVECNDGIDNDRDGKVDLQDLGCSSLSETNESRDQVIGSTSDRSVERILRRIEEQQRLRGSISPSVPLPECRDRIDNDRDFLIDYPDDGGCGSPDGNDEENLPFVACTDGIDNDHDNRIDEEDPGCDSDTDNSEFNASVVNRNPVRPPVFQEDAATVRLESSQMEVQPGTRITYTLRVRNTGDTDINGAEVVFDYDENQMTVVNAGGGTIGNSVHWFIDLSAGQTRALQVVMLVNKNLAHGAALEASARVLGVDGDPSAFASVGVIKAMPQTGMNDFFAPLEDTTRFVTQRQAASTALTLAWVGMIISGMVSGMMVGRRILP